MTDILIVEDDASVRGLLLRVLSSRDWRVDVAVDGREALQFLDRKEYSLMVVDLVMPVVSGFELLDALKGLGREIPTIIMSGIILPKVHDYLRTHPKVKILSKPFSRDVLLRAADELLGESDRPERRGRRKRRNPGGT